MNLRFFSKFIYMVSGCMETVYLLSFSRMDISVQAVGSLPGQTPRSSGRLHAGV